MMVWKPALFVVSAFAATLTPAPDLPVVKQYTTLAEDPQTCGELISTYSKLKEWEILYIITPKTFTCDQAIVLSRDHAGIDFNHSVVEVAYGALRPAVVLGGLHVNGVSPRKRHDVRIENLSIIGNRDMQQFECWGGPCDPARNNSVFWRERLNGVTVNQCDDCAVSNVQVTGARSGGMVTVGANRLLVDNFEATDSHFDGLAGYWTRDSVFRNVNVHDNGYSGFSFDSHFSGNRIEQFEAVGNRDLGLFIRVAKGNTFAKGLFAGNVKGSAYLDSPDGTTKFCANDTTFDNVDLVSVRWVFACTGTTFVETKADKCSGVVPEGLDDVCDTIVRDRQT